MTTETAPLRDVGADPRPQIAIASDGSVSILGTRCGSCLHAVAYRWARCPRCGGALEPETYAGRGVVWSTTVVHLAVGDFRPPYGLAYVDLDQGPRVLAHFGGAPVAIGDRVTIGNSPDGGLLVKGDDR